MNPDDQAYPIQGFCGPDDNVTYPEFGLTKRELAILMAMQGLCANPEHPSTIAILAIGAVRIADATLAAMQEQKI